MKIVVYNLGCKVNQYESDAIMRQLSQLGYEVHSDLVVADIYVINTCAVTAEAEKKSRQIVSKCKKFNANAPIIVCGCASQNNQEQFMEKDGVRYVSGVANKGKLPMILEEYGVNVSPLPKEYEDDLCALSLRTRAYVKVQDGCNNFCSYCLIPYLRGRSRSRKMESVVNECQSLSSGVKEIVLTGINLSAYGEDINLSLALLLMALKDIDVRIRIGSLEVGVVTKELLDATMQLKKFCPQFHLSLQSGDNATLKAMNRHYTVDDYADRVKLIREYYPDAGITTDIICGYPSEDERSANNTLEFVKKIKFSDIHIFAYSPREGTVAYKLKPLPSETVKERCQKLEEVRQTSRREFLSKFIGRQIEVLTEDGNTGYSREYIKVNVNQSIISNIIANVEPYEIMNEDVLAKIVSTEEL